MMSMRTTSPSSRSARRWASVAPTLPAPTTVTFLFMKPFLSRAAILPRPARQRHPAIAVRMSAQEARAMEYKLSHVPAGGAKISIKGGRLQVPDQPIVPFIEGDGTGPDIWRASVRVMDAAVEKAYGGKRKIHWMEVLAGQKSFDKHDTWLPDETVEA